MKNVLRRSFAFLLCVVLLSGSNAVQVFCAEADNEIANEMFENENQETEISEETSEEEYVDDSEEVIEKEEISEEISEEEEDISKEDLSEEDLSEEETEEISEDNETDSENEELSEDILEDEEDVAIEEELLSDAPTSGECGENATWEYDAESGTLTISGEGAMYDYDIRGDDEASNFVPWDKYISSINKAIISEEITHLGAGSFGNASNLAEIQLPEETLESIGDQAFYYCFTLTSFTIPNSVKTIGSRAFCFTTINDIVIPEGVSTIGDSVFCGATELKSVSFPSTITEIGYGIFSMCESLETVTYNGTEEDWKVNVSVGTGNDTLLKLLGFGSGEPEEIIKIASGSCGKNAKWKFESDGVLTISGKGAMNNYTENKKAPWSKYTKREIEEAGEKTYIQKVVIEDGITSIGNYAFMEFDISKGIVLPNSLKSIGKYAFFDTCGIKEIVLPEGFTTFGTGAFFYCNDLEKIYIPDSVKALSESCFDSCNKLSEVNIPKDVKVIPYCCFYECYRLNEIVLPDGLTKIDGYAFYHCSNLETINFPDGLLAIGAYALAGCLVKSIIIPENVTTIGDGAFSNSQVVSLTLNNKITAIPGYMCGECGKLSEINNTENVTAIGNGAFSYCSSLTSFNMERTTKIGMYAFFECTNLQEVEFPETLVSIDDSAFYNTGLYSAELPDSLKTMGERVFEECKNLQSASIPGSIQEIPDYAFFECEALTKVHMGYGIKTIGYSAFAYSGVNIVILPSSMTTIGECAFVGCGIDFIFLPNSLTKICAEAFGQPDGTYAYLEKETYVDEKEYAGTSEAYDKIIIEDGNEAFCYSGTGYGDNYIAWDYYDDNSYWLLSADGTLHLCVEGDMPNFDNEDEKNTLLEYSDYVTSIYAYDGITSIGENAFAGLDRLKTVVLPNSVEKIGKRAFSGCTNLQSIELSDKLTSIGDEAFCDCKNLSSLALPNSIEDIGKEAFANCNNLYVIDLPQYIYIKSYAFYNSGLRVINYDGNYIQWKSQDIDNDLKDNILNGNIVLNYKAPVISGKCGENLTYTIKDGVLTISGKGRMDNYCDDSPWQELGYEGVITSIVVEKGVESIGDYAFYYNISVNKVTLPNTVKSIGQYAFADCFSLTDITIPDSVTQMGNEVFLYCSGLKSVKLSKNLTDMGEAVFYNCTSLTSVNIPSSLEYINLQEFFNCSALKEVIIPSSVKTIKGSAFERCSSLKSVVISEGVEFIDTNCFTFCESLSYVVLPKSLSKIDNKAFEQNSEEVIVQISYPGTEEEFLQKVTVENKGLEDPLFPSCEINFESKVYFVKVDLNCDSELDYPDIFTCEIGTEYSMFEAPARECYKFAGWKLGKKVYKAGDKFKDLSTENGSFVTLVAQWTPDKEADAYKYSVHFVGNGETGGSMKDVTMTVGSAKKLPANTFTKKGYHFAGWSTENDNVVKFTDKQSVKDLNAGGAKGAVLFAVWEENTYTVTYNGNGGKFSDGKKNCKQTLKYGETETLRVQGEFKRTGYTFVGWSTSKKAKYAEYKDGSSVRNLSSKNNGNVNLYAVWKVNTYSIVFLSDEDSDGYETYGIVDTMVVPYGKSVKLNRNIMEFDGYCFTGWKCSNGKTYKDGATVKNLSSQPNGLVIMEPTWKDHIYTVKFNINGASGKTPDPITCSSSKDSVTIPKATGLEFAGRELIYWSTKPDGTGRFFDIYGDFSYRMSDKNVKYKKTITLYAVWRYEVNLDPGVGEGNIQKETRIWNSSQAIENPGFSKKGYKLVGWNTDKAKAENGTALKSVKNLPVDCTLYAVWAPIKYKICFFHGDYGVKDVYQTLTYDKEAALSANKFKKRGCTFAGWQYYDANKGETVVYQNKDKVLNLTDVDGEVLEFEAKWDYIKYNITYVLPQGAVNPSSNPTYYIINQQYYEGFDLKNPTMDGYTFKGWYKDSKYKKKFDGLEPDQIGALKLYAKFVKK